MSFSIQYKELFSLKISHKYFLDKGTVSFADLSETDQMKQLSNYRLSSFLKIYPTTETQRLLHGHKLTFRTTSSGFTVWTKVSNENNQKPFVELDHQLHLTFLVQVSDSSFFNYTQLNFDTFSKIFYFSNIKPGFDFPLLRKSGKPTSIDESFTIFSKNERIKASDNELIKKLKNLTAHQPGNLLGVIQISMKGESSNLNIVTTAGEIADPAQNFEIVFSNRKSLWRYLFNSDQSVDATDDLEIENGDSQVLITKKSYPLTQYGFISIKLNGKELPNPLITDFRVNNDKIYSEIYM